MQLPPPDDKILSLNQFKVCHLFATDASGTSWWPNLQSVQVGDNGGTRSACKVQVASIVAKFATIPSGAK